MKVLPAARSWWARRTLRVRITLTVGGVALVALLALSRLATALAFGELVDATDQELRTQAQQAVARLESGATDAPGVRVVDTAVTKDELLRLVWGDEQAASRNVVEVYVGYLRRKLDAVGAGDVVRTVRGHGYLVSSG